MSKINITPLADRVIIKQAGAETKTASGIIDSMRSQENRTIIMISHQLSAAAACDRVLVLDNGKLVQEGKHNELILKEGTYKRLWEREQAVEQLDVMC